MVKLVEKAKKGDKESFGIIVESIKNNAYKVAYSYTKNEEDAMDAVCDSILNAFKDIHKLNREEFFETWFIRIVINESKKILKRRKKVDALVDRIKEKEPLYTDNSFSEDFILLKDKLKKMKYVDRKIIYLKFYLGYKFKDIAKEMGISINTVKTKAYRGMEELKKAVN